VDGYNFSRLTSNLLGVRVIGDIRAPGLWLNLPSGALTIGALVSILYVKDGLLVDFTMRFLTLYAFKMDSFLSSVITCLKRSSLRLGLRD